MKKIFFSIKENKKKRTFNLTEVQSRMVSFEAVQKVYTCNGFKSNGQEMKTSNGVRHESMKL